MRNFKRILATAGLVAAMTVITGSASLASDSHRLSMVKNCAAWPPTCVVTASKPLGFMVGSVITYLTPATLGTPAGTDVRIDTANGKSSAPGHCRFDWTVAPPAGLCTFTSGSGKLSGFAARLNVAYLGGPDFSLIGTYRIDRDNDDANDD